MPVLKRSPHVFLLACLALGLLVGAATATALPADAQAAQAAQADPLLAEQWGLHRIGAPQAWGATRGEGVKIAVIDTGIALDHEDLSNQVGAATACLGTLGDPARCEGSAADDDGHGTHVAGIVAAEAGNGRGVVGVAPAAELMVVRALRQVCAPLADGGNDCRGIGATDDIRAAIRWAVDRGAHVINLSWADDVATRVAAGTPLAEEIHYAWERGVIVVVASGNDFDAAMGSGYGDLPMVVVTATTPDDARAAYANAVGSTPRWAFAAPGGDGTQQCPGRDVLSTYTGAGNAGGYGCLAGTSMAAPHVAGAIALLRSLGLTAQESLDRLIATAEDAGPPGADAQFGAGIVNVGRAVQGVTPRPGGPAAGMVTPAAPSAPPAAADGAAQPSTGTGGPSPAAAPPGSAPPPSPAPATPPAAGTPGDRPARPPAVDADRALSSRAPWIAVAVTLLLLDAALVAQYRRRVAELRSSRRA